MYFVLNAYIKNFITYALFVCTQHINKSLSALGDVIASLHGQAKHVPFRNSKLTMYLQDALSGNARTLMIAQVIILDIFLLLQLLGKYGYEEILQNIFLFSK